MKHWQERNHLFSVCYYVTVNTLFCLFFKHSLWKHEPQALIFFLVRILCKMPLFGASALSPFASQLCFSLYFCFSDLLFFL
uniref:Uncharacterized protein n=1 Tax=Mus spicilegus TaxID=10103 RepID=A0A8C6HE08_MUSSI